MAAENFSCPAWPVVALLDADTLQAQLAVVHADAETAHEDCACRLYTAAKMFDRLGMLSGPAPAAPYGCEAA